MSPLARLAAALIALAALPGASLAAPFPGLSDVQAVPVSTGVNRVAAMTADGREGLIVEGFKNYVTADGSHDAYMVLTAAATPGGGWGLVTAGAGAGVAPTDPEVLGDAPHTGEDFVRAVRFARARLHGRPAFVLLVAQRSMDGPIPAPSHVTIRLYALETSDDVDADHFVLKGEFKPQACYGDANLALDKEVGLALPKDYEGPDAAGICGVG